MTSRESVIPAVQASALAILVLAACHSNRELTASEAIQVADNLLVAELPQMKHHMFNVKAEADVRASRWRVIYYGGTGGVTIFVDMRNGRAEISEVQQ